MGFLYVSRFSILEALQYFSQALQRFAKADGKPNLYHKRITWAFLFLIPERLVVQSSRHNGQHATWYEFAADKPDLLNRKSNLILSNYYFEETLKSELARKVFILPNRSLSEPRGGNSQ